MPRKLKGSEQENATAGGFFATIKTEFIFPDRSKARGEAPLAVIRYIQGSTIRSGGFGPVTIAPRNMKVCFRGVKVSTATGQVRGAADTIT